MNCRSRASINRATTPLIVQNATESFARTVLELVSAGRPLTDALKTRITLGVTPVKGSKNTVTAVSITRGARVVKPATQSLEPPGGRFIFDFAAFAPTSDITIELVGNIRTRTCLIEKPVLALLR